MILKYTKIGREPLPCKKETVCWAYTNLRERLILTWLYLCLKPLDGWTRGTDVDNSNKLGLRYAFTLLVRGMRVYLVAPSEIHETVKDDILKDKENAVTQGKRDDSGWQKLRRMELLLQLKHDHSSVFTSYILWKKHRICTDAINSILPTFFGSKSHVYQL